jgi:hypothetical protein
LKRDDIEAVDVALHNNLHMPATVAGLQAGKHVYCEKPMVGATATPSDAGRRKGVPQARHPALLAVHRRTKAAKALIDGGHWAGCTTRAHQHRFAQT